MPTLSTRLTDKTARTLPLPAKPASGSAKEFHYCPVTTGFGLRVSSSGDIAYFMERRINGKSTRRTLGKAVGAGAISADAARKLQITVSSELQQGVDRTIERKAERAAGVTLADAVKVYVKEKRRAKDGLALKERTRNDYLAMVAPGGTRKNGSKFADGALCSIAGKPVSKITGDDIRKVYKAATAKSQRQGTYAMQVLRAVLNWQGVEVPDSPLTKTTAGKDRIVLAPTKKAPRPIPPEQLGAWWKAATARTGVAADACRFILLTGCRPGEVFGDKFGNTGLLVGNVDGDRLLLHDTKNRTDQTLFASKQVLEILETNCKGKKPTDKVFDILDPGKTLDAINRDAGVTGITPHKLRHTFASVADELVSGYAVKRMLNHTLDGGDVTGGYIGKSDAQLRAAWQTVADAISGA